MNHINSINQNISKFVDELVDLHAHYDERDNQFVITLADIPDFSVNEFSSMLLQDPHFASEATSVDNKEYESKMLPALIGYMKNITNKDSEIEFLNQWKKGVTEYHKSILLELLSKSIERYQTDYLDHLPSRNLQEYPAWY